MLPDVVAADEGFEISGGKERRQPELSSRDRFVTCCQRTTSWSGSTGFSNFGWLHEEVPEPYDAEIGRPSIDPEVALRLMLAGFLLGLIHDRRLMHEA